MFELIFLLQIFLVFLISGLVKGIVGLGLPTISLGMMVIFTELPIAMALLVFPSLITNLWQACTGGTAMVLLRRLWGFFLLAIAFIFLGAYLGAQAPASLLILLLGVVLIIYGLSGLAGFTITIPAKLEIITGIVSGAINGVLTGLTGSFTVPGVLYLQSIGLSKTELVQAMGMLFLFSTLSLGASLGIRGIYSLEFVGWSLASVLPAMAGMVIGKGIRGYLTEHSFKKALFATLFLLGSYLTVSGFLD